MNELTIAICAYNCQKYIEETLSCIINQTFNNFDLIIINDGSTDNTQELIQNYLKKFNKKFKIVNFHENKGLAFGRSFVENNVFTKYILFIDADDCPYPEMVKKLYDKISTDDDLMAVGCYHKFIDNKSKFIGGGIYMGETSKEAFYNKAKNKKLIFMQPTAIINREVLLKVGGRNINGFFENKPRYQDLCEDLDLWTRMSDLYVERKAIVVLPEVLCRYRKHEHSLSSNSYGMVLRMKHIKMNLLLRRSNIPEKSFIEFYNSISKDEMKCLINKSKAIDYLRMSILFLKKGKLYIGIKYLYQSIFLDPIYIYQKLKANSGILKKIK